jgi:putative ABC transport system permease protein
MKWLPLQVMVTLKLFYESIVFALKAIVINKVRTILSLLGITIGIFSIISVFTVFDSMEIAIKKSFESLGDDVLFITKWPLIGDAKMPWWKYWNRPQPSVKEMKEIQKRSQGTEYVTTILDLSKTVRYGSRYINNASITAVSQDYNQVIHFELSEGRYFTPVESVSARPVAVIGSDIASNLFESLDPVGRRITLMGRKLDVIGVFKKEGSDNFGNSHDNVVLIPIEFAGDLIDMRNTGMTIIVKAKPNVSTDQLKDELTGIMRSVRKLKPSAENNFDISEISLLTSFVDNLFGVISIVGWIIGGFSLLVGGFGIANIMFVSVKERTGLIGIQKSLGAKRYFILMQFIFEAVFLSLIGGIVGLILVFIGTYLGSDLIKMELILTTKNVMIALGVSGFIGFVFGFIPAYAAARLDPVKAMRSTF